MDINQKIALINERVDPDELVDVLGLTTQELVDKLYIPILRKLERFDYVWATEAEAQETLDTECDGG